MAPLKASNAERMMQTAEMERRCVVSKRVSAAIATMPIVRKGMSVVNCSS